MSLTFTNPFLLFGLAAVVLPILIHRIVQRKAVSRRFSAVRLLIESQKFTARPYRLKDILLLLLRVLAVATLIVLAARPVFLKGSPAVHTRSAARLIILDNSLSMGYRDDGGVRFEQAKQAARELIAGFAGQVAIIPTVSSTGRKGEDSSAGWMRAADALNTLETVRLSFSKGDLDSAFARSVQAMRHVNMSKEIVIISDMARSDWGSKGEASLAGGADDIITLVRISGPQRDPNLSVKAVRLIEGEAIVGARTRLEATVSNLSDEAASTMVQLYAADAKIDQKQIELKAGREERVFFDVYLDKPGFTACEVRLSGDRLVADDTFYFTLKARERLPVLVVDGDPRTVPRTSESYYLVSALRPSGSDTTPFSVRVATAEEFSRIDLAEYEALFLLNVANPPASGLSSFLRSGKPIFIFLGDRVSRDAYNAFPFLTAKLTEIRSLGDRPERVFHMDSTREPLKSLAATDYGGGRKAASASQAGHQGSLLSGASFTKYYAVDGRGKRLLTFGSGEPFLLEMEAGRGRIFLFTSSADLDWNDFALKASFLPLVQGLLREALGLPGSALPEPGTLGQFAGSSGGPSSKPHGPSTDACRPLYAPVAEGPGIYRCTAATGDLVRGFNPPFEESDLAKLSDDELRKRFVSAHVRMVTYDPSSAGGLAIGRKELWPTLLVVLLTLLAVEMILAHLFSRPRSTPPREAVG